MSNFITPSEAARRAGISRQGMASLKKNGSYNFFVKDGKKIKVDTNHPHWKGYLDSREIEVESDSGNAENKIVGVIKNKNGVKTGKKKPTRKNKNESEQKPGKKHTDETLLKNEDTKQKNALTGGYDPKNFIPTSPTQLKSLTDIEEKKINMRVKLGELVEAEMVAAIMESVTNDIRSLVNLPRKVSGLICQKLDAVGREKTVEAIIAPVVESIIKMLKKNMAKSIDIKSFKR